MKQEYGDVLALFGVSGVGAKTYTRLIGRFSSPSAVFSASDRDLLAMEGIGPVILKNIRTFDRSAFVDAQEKLMEASGVTLCTRTSPDYPPLLNAFKSAPPVLFVRGDVKALSLPSLAFVGTRKPTDYGVTMTRELVRGTVEADMCVVSGMAAGIDSAAHRTALDNGGKTVAVLGCGVDIIYPESNRKLSEQIMQSGCLVSHFPMGIFPDRGNFPARNAVITGLSLGTVVVEAPKKSGALITAELTLKAGRPLFTVPGNATSLTSEGTNNLLARGAIPVQSIKDVLTALGKPIPPTVKYSKPVSLPKKRTVLPGRAGDILKYLDNGPQHVDVLCSKLKIPVFELLNELTMLEIKGYVKQNPGKIFEIL
ncbi:MAG: DNA-processing protein DprA [Candidatus Latescibacteria bacterium]|nr:DNA-processing protein DprA [Candidatus Latescibacterota bacterium]